MLGQMKVAIYDNLPSGGGKREVYEYARQFTDAGHIVHLYTPSTCNTSFLPLRDIVECHFEFELPLISPLPLRFPGLTRYFGLGGFFVNLHCIDQVARRMAAQIDRGHYDFVLVHTDRLVKNPVILRYLRTKTLFFCHEPPRDLYEAPPRRQCMETHCLVERAQRTWYAPTRWICNRVTKRLDAQNIRYADMVVTNSFYAAEGIRRAYGLGARVAYLGVDPEQFRPLGLERQNAVLSVGALSAYKGYDFLIEALSLINPDERPCLIIVGNTNSGSERAFLEHLARTRHVDVKFHINVAVDKLVRLYNSVRAVVYAPILEPFGLPVLEAAACGTPIVAVREGGVRESVRDGITGLLVQRDEQAFAHALLRILRNPEWAVALGANGRDEVLRSWTWQHAYDRLMEHIDRLVGQ